MSTVCIPLNLNEIDKLLELIGHDEHIVDYDVVKLVHALYLAKVAFTPKTQSLDLEVDEAQLMILHRYVTPQIFGPGGREFVMKLATAIVEVERSEDMPDVSVCEDATEWDDETRLRMAKWKEEMD